MTCILIMSDGNTHKEITREDITGLNRLELNEKEEQMRLSCGDDAEVTFRTEEK